MARDRRLSVTSPKSSQKARKRTVAKATHEATMEEPKKEEPMKEETKKEEPSKEEAPRFQIGDAVTVDGDTGKVIQINMEREDSYQVELEETVDDEPMWHSGMELVPVEKASANTSTAVTTRKSRCSVTVISASGLRAADIGCRSDPYVVCKVPSKPISEATTSFKSRMLNPEWNEILEIEGWESGDELHFECWDHDYTSADDFLGYGKICAQSIDRARSGQEHEVVLCDDGKHGAVGKKAKGTIKVTLCIDGGNKASEHVAAQDRLPAEAAEGADAPGPEQDLLGSEATSATKTAEEPVLRKEPKKPAAARRAAKRRTTHFELDGVAADGAAIRGEGASPSLQEAPHGPSPQPPAAAVPFESFLKRELSELEARVMAEYQKLAHTAHGHLSETERPDTVSHQQPAAPDYQSSGTTIGFDAPRSEATFLLRTRGLDPPASGGPSPGSSYPLPPQYDSGQSLTQAQKNIFSLKSTQTLRDEKNVTDIATKRKAGIRGRLQDVVLNPYFETVAMLNVVTNAILVGAQTEATVRWRTMEVPRGLMVAEAICCWLFLLEVALRIIANRKHFLFGPGRVLNRLDVVLVCSQVTEVIVSACVTGNSYDRKVNFAIARGLRLARVVRLVRSVRFLQVFHEVRSMILSIVISMRPLFGAVVILAFLMYVFSVVFIEMVLEDMIEEGESETGQKLALYFGSMASSVSTLILCVTGGLSWGEVAVVLPPFGRSVILPLFILWTMLGMFNIITGTFVESTSSRIKTDQMQLLYNCFEAHVDAYLKRKTSEGEPKLDAIDQQQLREALGENTKLQKKLGLSTKTLEKIFALHGTRTYPVRDLINEVGILLGPARRLEQEVMTQKKVSRYRAALHVEAALPGPPAET